MVLVTGYIIRNDTLEQITKKNIVYKVSHTEKTKHSRSITEQKSYYSKHKTFDYLIGRVSSQRHTLINSWKLCYLNSNQWRQ